MNTHTTFTYTHCLNMEDTPNYLKVIPQLQIPSTPRSKPEPDYLDYDMRGRGFMERAFANTGLVYLLGVLGGSIRGLAVSNSMPNATFKIKFNSFLNTLGKHGSRTGNSLGTMAFMYTALESAIDQSEIGRYVVNDHELFTPIIAASATGALYGSAKGMRAGGLAGVIGGGVVLGTYAVTSAVGPVFGLGFQKGNVLFL